MSEQNESRSANGYIKTVMLGNLGADPEMRYTPGGSPVTNFRMAINQRVYVEGEYIVAPLWVKVTCWGKLAEVTNQYLRQGSQCLVEVDRVDFDLETGGPKVFARNDGSAGANYEFVAKSVLFVGARMSDGEPREAGQPEDPLTIPF